ncbi:putative PAN domain-containing protein [Acanthamoeba castellanii mimivirus]|uniref:Putative PAN domain-containing protein R486 n=4 Tax=Mimivirus TaxID=315393 RepID=YR486_MIMIV|nr:putative PAN domain-containing protein [Acanthamoeba polyphaga mimivirus]Q5UQG0.1 RecName: Full=Putative PAN domain-containing protein R486; Flags: Precursor [Acanthamoeba polyphaga mimivirus]AEQ60676.1 PAN domain-containing protein [Acanthamoeba castellanii mamavirus]AHA45371.1 putative PAN domain-containing protein [Hirudovirus strain Sangsue]ALR84075.1 PAN domain-containing protein [Niemeyer virus]AMZ02929.1 putative PAN domain-containing protein [Mimivirus Bombay]EJN40920.1 hypothetica
MSQTAIIIWIVVIIILLVLGGLGAYFFYSRYRHRKNIPPTPINPPSSITPIQPINPPSSITPIQPSGPPSGGNHPIPASCPAYQLVNNKAITLVPLPADTSNVKNAQDCQNLCTQNPDCYFYNYVGLFDGCSLMQGTVDNNVMTGFAIRGSEDGCPKWARYNTSIQGFNTGNPSNVESEEKCQQLCQQNSSCDWYTYDIGKKTCTLNKAIDFNTSTLGIKMPH